ncbi:SLAP domain-containing protein [Lactobacillus acetotolerans]|uniref:SLAP domain-containing protein n=5 Tax=Lactobacillus acetotolerans TaxID=1600 RepID=UPI0014519ADF|nr:SLAP domain-containing protein [Lactobacillus acetotolerans]QJD73186.1 BspA family leucine-rich repeat surface protein [Lactobacillus acetotolerans]
MEDSTQIEPAAAKQTSKPDLSTFPGLSMFFTDVKNADAKDNAAKTPAQDTNAGKNDQDQADAKSDKTSTATLTSAEKTPAAPKKDDALTTAASDLQSAIDKGDAYVNSDKFTQMTVEKQKQLRDAIQTGKELMAKYNTMQTAMNSAALEVDQNNKNKAETKADANVAALTTLNVNNNTSADINKNPSIDNPTTDPNKTPATDITTITAPELIQATQNIIMLLGTPAVNNNISWDTTTQTVTISAGEINNNWTSVLPDGFKVKHIIINGKVTVANGDATELFSLDQYTWALSTLQDITGIDKLDTHDIVNMSKMFESDSNLTSLDVSKFDTSNVTNMSEMFNGVPALTSLDVSNFNTSNVTSMYEMFAGDMGLTSLNVSSFDTSNVTDMHEMFEDTNNLTSLNISNFNTNNVTNMDSMFQRSGLEKLTLGEQTKLLSDSDLQLPGGSTWYKNADPTQGTNIADGKDHVGTWYKTPNGVVNITFINVKHNISVGTAQVTVPNNTTLNLTPSDPNFDTNITHNIPDGYKYAKTTAELHGNKQLVSTEYSTISTNTINVYVVGNPLTDISIKWINAKNGDTITSGTQPTDTRYGDKLDLKTDGMPVGYSYVEQTDLDKINLANNPQTSYKQNDPSTVTLKKSNQEFPVYVIGDPVPDDGTNKDAVHVLHYLESQDNKPTTDKVPGIKVNDYWLGGYYGDTVTASGTDEKQKAPTGYTIVNPKKQSYELVKNATKQPEFIFYYKADKEAHLSVQFVNARTGKDVGKALKAPDGYMDKPFDPTDTNSFITSNIPDSYHYAKTSDELNGKTQPKNDGSIKYTDQDYTVPVYVAGDDVPDDGTNKDAVHVLHYLESQDDKPTTDKVPGIKVSDYWLGGHYGDTVTASGTDEKQKAPTGYTIVNPKKQSYELVKGATKQSEFIFYYKADKEVHLSVQYVNARTGKDVGQAIKAPDGYMNKPFDPTDSNSFIKTNIPAGYHYAMTTEDLNGKTQPKNDGSVKYTDQDYTVNVYVAGDTVPDDGTNKDAVHVLHYLENQDGTPTTDLVPNIKVNDYWLGGYYGDTVTASGTDEKQKAPDGYTIANPDKQSYELIKGATTQPEFTFYYKADAEANLSVQYVNARTGKDVGKAIKAPDGYMNKPFDPTDSNSFITINIPDGYHYATTSDELHGKTQPKNDGSIKYTDQDYTVPVYVAGDNVPDDGTNTDAIHVLHRLQSDDSELKGSYWIGGNYGDEITVKDSDAKQTVVGYTIVPKDSVTLELTQDTPHQVIFYYTANAVANVTINFTTKNGTIIKSDVPQGHHTGDTLQIGAGSSYFTTTKPNGFRYASGTEVPSDYTQPTSVTYSGDSQTVIIYVAGESVGAGDTVKVVHYMDGTTKPVPGLTDYVLGADGHYGDTVTASGDDAAQKAPFGYKLVNPATQTYVLTKGAPRTFIFYYTKNGGGSLPEPDRTPKLPIPGEVDIPQGTDLSGDTTYAGDAITNKDQMPDGTKYSWQPAPDTSKKGKQEGTVVVTYPDGTKVSVNVTVNIVDKDANGNGNNGNNNHGEAKEEVLKHNAYLYGQDGKRANKAVLKAGSTVTTYGLVVINGRKFFTLDNDYYLATGNAVARTRKLKHNAYIYNKYGQRVGKKVFKTGQSMATYGTVVTIRGKKYYTIDHNHFMKANNFTKIAYPDLANSELSPNAKQDSDKAFTVKALQHNAYLYNKEGKRANKVILNLNSKVKTYGTTTINGRKFYVAANDYYIAAGNIDATKRKLTHNAYIYSQYGNRIGRKVVKQHQVVGTYGDPVGIRGKSYYIIGSGRYLKRANFETR